MSKNIHHAVTLTTVMTCPHCQAEASQVMLEGSSDPSFACQACHATHAPKPDECCIYCSYGSVRCPPIQEITLFYN